MPIPPEYGNVFSFIRRIEVLRNVYVEHFPQTYCHIAVAAEIKIQLQRIREHNYKAAQAVNNRHGIGKAHGDRITHAVRNKNFFAKPHRKNIYSARKVFPIEAFFAVIQKLRDKLIVRDNRARDKLRKKGYETGVFKKTVIRNLAVESVRHEGNLLKREKADAEREKNIFKRPIAPKERVDGGNEEIIIFEIEQHAQI